MEITKSGIAVLVALCGAAGAGGAYVATRGSLDPVTESVPAARPEEPGVESPASALPAATPTADRTVQTTATPARVASVARSNGQAPAAARPASSQPAQAAPIGERAASTPEAVADLSTSVSHEPEPVRAPEEAAVNPPEPDFEELVVESNVVLGLQMDTSISSDTARVEDQVIAHVTRDVRVADRIAIPSGAKAYGEVTFVERGGRLRERARLGVRFSSLLLADGSRVPMATDVVFRDGDAPSRESAAKIGGGAIGGAIIGGILGGGKGAILGGTAGAGAGTAAVLAGGRHAATLPAGTPVTVRLTRPVAVTVDR
jgi:hypothetical protein